MKKIALILAFCAISLCLQAQAQKSEKDRQKQFFEAIDTQVDRLTELLDLEEWQAFYVDSILTHDYAALQQEFDYLQKSKVTNSDLFYDIQDKWSEQIYNSLHEVFTEDQWAKYLKSGAAREKKARDKRAAKKN